MNCDKRIGHNYLLLAISSMIALFTFSDGCNSTKKGKQAGMTIVAAAALPLSPLSANDVSLLFPAPVTTADFDKLIAVGDLTTPNAQDSTKRDPVWPDVAFQQFVANADGPAAQIEGTETRMTLPDEAKTIGAWFIAGIRIDAGAPGLSSDIREQFGNLPEIRLIVQPVTRNSDGSPKVLDIAGHLVFDFITTPIAPAQSDCAPRASPDRDAFDSVVLDLSALRNRLRDGQLSAHRVITDGTPLGVHPAFLEPDAAVNFRSELKSFLEKHISGERLDAMSIAGLPSGAAAPWIFLSMSKIPGGIVAGMPNGGFVPVHGPGLDGDQQFAQMLQPVGTNPRVVPDPHTNNLNPISCRNGAVSPTSLPISNRTGVATADLFTTPPPSPDRTSQILDVISDPTKSHFFNTDCVSCHTETRRAMDLQDVKHISGIDSSALPSGQWNVRNFGWSPSANGPQATVTRRTANETASVVNFINSQVLNKRLH
jgi:hypothetical protein